MSRYVAIRDGGKTSEEGFVRLLNKVAGTQNKGKVGSGDFAVAQHSTPNMSVDVSTGDIIIPYLNYFFHGWSDALEVVTVATADPSNPRIDRTVAYIDLAVVSSSSSNNPNALKLKTVAGTPAGSPSRPSDPTVQTSVGAGNPFVDLGDLAVGAAVTSIVTANITDKRDLFTLGGGAGNPVFAIVGTLVVGNDITPRWLAAKPGTFIAVYVNVKTAPTGQALTGRVNKNGSQVATFSVAAGATTTNTTGLAITYVAGDYFSLDVTQVGSTVAGADLSVAIG